MTLPDTPNWLSTPCPSWCARIHEQDDHPEDRFHQSDPSHVAVLAAAERTIPVLQTPTATDLVIRIGQYVDDWDAWVAIEAAETPEPRLILTLESARFLTRALEEQLAQYDGQHQPTAEPVS